MKKERDTELGFRLLIIILVLLGASALLYPTLRWYVLYDSSQRDLVYLTSSQTRSYLDESLEKFWIRMNDFLNEESLSEPLSEPFKKEFPFLIKEARSRARELNQSWTHQIALKDFLGLFNSKEDFERVAEREYFDRLKRSKGKNLFVSQLGLDLAGGVSVSIKMDEEDLKKQFSELSEGILSNDLVVQDVFSRSIEVLRSRVDRYGLREPQIRQDINARRIFFDLPGEDISQEDLNLLLSSKNDLRFQVLNEEASAQIGQGVPRESLKDVQVYPAFSVDDYGLERYEADYAVYDTADAILLGEWIRSVRSDRDYITNKPRVIFSLDVVGTEVFRNLTQKYLNQSMAIIVNNQIKEIIYISEVIPAGQVSIGGNNFTEVDAQRYSLILQSGSFPVQFLVENVEKVGPTLGADLIRRGLWAILLGFLIVCLFMIVYYKIAGLIASLALILGFFVIMAILSAFSFTITLTGLAGLVLTVGMAVDANVIIFERIKEEYRAGRSPRAAVDLGFKKGFWTIFDSNITTFFVALFISLISVGSIKGFAFTLAWGIIVSLFMALFLSRFFFDVYLKWVKNQKISIGWGLK